VVVIYDWFDGELLRCPPDRRGDPDAAHNRFKCLHPAEIAAALDQVIALHAELERAGWIGGDFYDGSLMYDFAAGHVKVMDFECYRKGPYVNDEGRLPGSSRFMAPEEFRLHATIDSRTTVFNLGRLIELFLLAHNELPEVRALVDGATATDPDERPATVASLHQCWSQAMSRANSPQGNP
jgi:serine/threonine-protein kinase